MDNEDVSSYTRGVTHGNAGSLASSGKLTPGPKIYEHLISYCVKSPH